MAAAEVGQIYNRRTAILARIASSPRRVGNRAPNGALCREQPQAISQERTSKNR